MAAARRIAVDTNVLVSFLTDRDPAQQRRAAALFESARSGEREIVLCDAVLIELVYVLGNVYGLTPDEIREIAQELIELPFVEVAGGVHWRDLLDAWPSPFTDFGDALLAAAVKRGQADAVTTFDRRFVRELRRRGITLADV